MTLNRFLLILYPSLLIILAAYLLFIQKDRTAFFYNQKVFDQFKGKLELETKLKKQRETDEAKLDSLAKLIQAGRNDLSGLYNENLNRATQTQQELSARYTNDIWKYINDEVAKFGEENGYDYILGATGSGSLMYADSSRDVTNDVIKYINQKYEVGGH